MDPLILPNYETSDRAGQIADSLNAQRDRAEKFLEEHLSRLDSVEAALHGQLELMRSGAAPCKTPGGHASDDDCQRRYEMALDDLREMKAKNADLQRQLDESRKASKSAPAVVNSVTGRLDWEAEKLRILAALEADLDDADPKQHADRIEIEEAIKLTDTAIQNKDREIEELKRQLAEAKNESENGSSLSAVDADAVILQERQRLAQLQEEWQDKYRRAEVEMSTERARLARREAELEERAKALMAAPDDENAALAEESDQSAQSAGKRWLTRLGLTEEDWTYRKRK